MTQIRYQNQDQTGSAGISWPDGRTAAREFFYVFWILRTLNTTLKLDNVKLSSREAPNLCSHMLAGQNLRYRFWRWLPSYPSLFFKAQTWCRGGGLTHIFPRPSPLKNRCLGCVARAVGPPDPHRGRFTVPEAKTTR